MLRIAACCMLCAVIVRVPVTARAAKVKVWDQHTPSHYEKAQFKQAVVSSDGVIRLGAAAEAVRRTWTPRTSGTWWRTSDGNLFAATGDEGKVYKVTADGKASVVYAERTEPGVLSRPRRRTAPSTPAPGRTARSSASMPPARRKVFCETGEAYVWSLAVDRRPGRSTPAPGRTAASSKISPEGKPACSTRRSRTHPLRGRGRRRHGLRRHGQGRSRLSHRSRKGKGFVLYQAAQAEVRTLKVTAGRGLRRHQCADRSGAAAAAAVAPAAATAAARSTPSAEAAAVGKASKDGEQETATVKKTAACRTATRTASAARPRPPRRQSSGENSVYRIGLDGTVREVFREKAMVLSLLRQGEPLLRRHRHGRPAVRGRRGDARDTARSPGWTTARSCACAAGKTAPSCSAPAIPANSTSCEDRYAAAGTVLSEVLDAKIVSKWGALRWEARHAGEDTRVSVAVRSGNIAEPDDTWSDWSAEQTDAEQGDHRRAAGPLPAIPRDAGHGQSGASRRPCAAWRCATRRPTRRRR